MRVLVTGSTGLLGNNVVRHLLHDGHDVRVLLRPESRVRAIDGLDVDRCTGALDNGAVLRKAVDGVDAIVHSAALIWLGWTRMQESRGINVDVTRRLAEAAARRKARFVQISTVDTLAAGKQDKPAREEDLEPAKTPCSYVVSKREGEQAILNLVPNGLDAVIVHPGFMIGPWDWQPSSGQMMLAIAKQFVPFAPGGGLSVIDVRDAARGVVQALERGRSGERYILAGNNMTYIDLWILMANVMHRPAARRAISDPVARVVGFAGDLLSKLTGREALVNSAALKLGQMYHYYRCDKAARELGYTFGPVRPAVEDAWKWFKDHDYV